MDEDENIETQNNDIETIDIENEFEDVILEEKNEAGENNIDEENAPDENGIDEENKEEQEQKFEIIAGNGSEIEISPVGEYLNAMQPKTQDEKTKKQIVIPQVKNFGNSESQESNENRAFEDSEDQESDKNSEN